MKGRTLTATFTFSSDILSVFLQCPQFEKYILFRQVYVISYRKHLPESWPPYCEALFHWLVAREPVKILRSVSIARNGGIT